MIERHHVTAVIFASEKIVYEVFTEKGIVEDFDGYSKQDEEQQVHIQRVFKAAMIEAYQQLLLMGLPAINDPTHQAHQAILKLIEESTS